jgi:hypothetical protein
MPFIAIPEFTLVTRVPSGTPPRALIMHSNAIGASALRREETALRVLPVSGYCESY